MVLINRKQRVVVKIGSSSLMNEDGELSKEKINHYVKMMIRLKDEGHEVILVTSGAVAAGFRLLGYPTRPTTIDGKQAAAAVGQGLLIQEYTEAFRNYNYTAAQILLTRNDFSNRKQYNNAYNAFTVLLKKEVVPIINENDTVAIDELTFGDNDRLSALVAGLIHADTLIILTDTDGLYDSNPKINPKANKFTNIEEITPDIEALASGAGSSYGTGGMSSKVQAAKLALSLGVHVYIGLGKSEEDLLNIILGNGTGTYFGHPTLHTLKKKKQWIAFHSDVNGKIMVDDGAANALVKGGKSLLPAGVKKIVSHFYAGNVVEVCNNKGLVIGKGVVNYSSFQLEEVMGDSLDSAKKQVNVDRAEVIHRDEWITLQEDVEEEIKI